jgi:porin
VTRAARDGKRPRRALFVLPVAAIAWAAASQAPVYGQEVLEADPLAQDTTEFKSGFEDVAKAGGETAVGADLKDDDRKKNSLLGWDLPRTIAPGIYDLKRKIKDALGLAIGVDYSFLNQFSSFSTTDTQAASGIFRIFGTWRLFGDLVGSSGHLVYRVENRHLLGSGIVPRDLGFDGGSSLSTATFKRFDWGVTSLYWKQMFKRDRYFFTVGKMDPGDFSDVYLMLTAYKAFMGDAYFNNPTVALPQQGFGIVGAAGFTDNWYVAGGLHDANGSPTQLGLDSFFDVREYYSWIELGWRWSGTGVLDGQSVHVNVWRQDARQEAGTEETWGVTFSANPMYESPVRWSPFLRAGYSEHDGGQLVRFLLAGGLGVFVRKSDLVGVATSWSGPPDSSLRNQLTTEAFYRLQLTENLQVTPVVQFTIHPSQTTEVDTLWVTSVLRVRYSL